MRKHRSFVGSVVWLSLSGCLAAGCGGNDVGMGSDQDTGSVGDDGSVQDSAQDTALDSAGDDSTTADTATTTDSAGDDSTTSDSGTGDSVVATDSGTGDSATGDAATGSDSTTTSDTGGSADSGTTDAVTTDAVSTDAVSTDTAGMVCTPGAACSLSGANGVCKSDGSACVACPSADATGDGACVSAYGAGYLCLAGASGNACTLASCRVAADCATKGQLCVANACSACTTDAQCGAGSICTSGLCVAGNCHTSTDCDVGATVGQVCGASAPSTCGACGKDGDCAGDAYYAGKGQTICEGGQCKAPTCASASGSPPSRCPGASAAQGDLCCANACVPNTAPTGTSAVGCCASTDCTSGSTCIGNVCTTCAAVTGGQYYVDPVGGTDAGSGANTTGCAFKTIKRALQVIGSTGQVATINLLGTASAATGETFPIVLPKNVTLAGVPSAGSTTQTIQAGSAAVAPAYAIVVGDAAVAIKNITLDGTATSAATKQATRGIWVVNGAATSASLSLDHVTVKAMANEGIVVGHATGAGATTKYFGGGLTIAAGVHVDSNGLVAGSSGVVARGTATVGISDASGDQDTFNLNGQHGIAIVEGASISVTGTANYTTPTSSTVLANGNASAGLLVAQASVLPGTTTKPTKCVVRGYAVVGTTNGNGFRIEGGSQLSLRGSIAIGAKGSGVFLTSSANNPAPSNVDFTGVELGASPNPGGDAGNNLFQVAPGGTLAPNLGAGICLALPATTTGVTITARGNRLVTNAKPAANVDCTLGAATVSATAACANGVAVGGSIRAISTNKVDVSQCTYTAP
jgi:hypothetical protein